MNYEIIGITVLWTFLYGYIIVGSIDFGAGFLMLYSKLRSKEDIIEPIIQRYLNPVWEVTNVFFVFFFVGIVGFFPETALYYGTSLLIPGSIALVLIAMRGSFYAFNSYNNEPKLSWKFIYGVTGLLIPASLSVALAISEGGFIIVSNGEVSLDLLQLLTNPYAWSVVTLSIILVLYVSSAFLTFYAHRAQSYEARDILRKWFLIWVIPMLVISLLTFVGLRMQNELHFNNALNYWYLFVLSIIFMVIAVFLIYKKRHFGIAFLMVMLQFAFAFYGYGISKLPYILYPFIHLESSVVNDEMALALTVVFILGLMMLIPALGLLMRLFLFDSDYVVGNKTDY